MAEKRTAKKNAKTKRKKKLRMLPLSKPVTPTDIIDRARQYGPACIDTLADVAANGTDAARVSAAGTLLERGFGKVGQTIDHTSSDRSMSPAPVIDLSGLDADRLMALTKQVFGGSA